MSRRWKPEPLGVEAGQTYRVRRAGKPAAHVRVVKVVGREGPQPKIWYRPVTKSGGPKPIGLGKKVKHLTSWMARRDGQWCPPPEWELVEPEE